MARLLCWLGFHDTGPLHVSRRFSVCTRCRVTVWEFWQ